MNKLMGKKKEEKGMKKIGLMLMILAIGLAVFSPKAQAITVTETTTLLTVDSIKEVTVVATAVDDIIADYWKYTYEVTNVNFDNLMYGFQVLNSYNFTVSELTTPANWSFVSRLGYFQWTTSTAPLGVEASLTFEMKTPISEGSYPGRQYAEAQDGDDCIGTTLSPVPEPATMLLLGSGLLGLAGFRRIRRRV